MQDSKGPRFRSAITSDADGLARLERSASLVALAHIFPPEQFPYPTDDVRDRWLKLLSDPAVRVGVSEDVDGLASLVAFDGEVLRHLAVRPDLWGAGHAKAAMRWAMDREPIHRLWCLEENSRALGFYEHLRWVRTGRRQHAEFPPYPVEIELARTRDRDHTSYWRQDVGSPAVFDASGSSP